VFCPKSVKQGWFEELAQWAPHLKAVVVDGSKKQRVELWQEDADVHIANYQLLLHDFQEIDKREWDLIAADEATVVSNPDAKTTQHLKKLKAHRKIPMTGTPLSNKIQDIWSLVDWVDPGRLGSYFMFEKTYCTTDRYGNINGYRNLSQLKHFTDPLMIRRRKKDVLTELPPKSYEKIVVELSPDERRIYKLLQNTVLKEAKEHLKNEGVSTRGLASRFVRDIRLRQAANAVQLITNEPYKSSKIEELKALLPVLFENDEKVLVFTQFRVVAELLAKELEKYNPLQITGAVSEEDRTANRHLFNESPTHNLMILTSAGNMGLNLQSASSVIHFDLPWSVAQLEQREDRAHRNGQKKNVTVYKIIAKDTIDEFMLSRVESKKAMSAEMLDDELELDLEVEAESYLASMYK
jgi:SNF2 family DNA or RNA helicase